MADRMGVLALGVRFNGNRPTSSSCPPGRTPCTVSTGSCSCDLSVSCASTDRSASDGSTWSLSRDASWQFKWVLRLSELCPHHSHEWVCGMLVYAQFSSKENAMWLFLAACVHQCVRGQFTWRCTHRHPCRAHDTACSTCLCLAHDTACSTCLFSGCLRSSIG